MKKALLFSFCTIIITISGLFALGSAWTSVDYYTFRTVTDTEDTQLTATTQKTAPDSTDDGTVDLKQNVGAIHIRFKGTAAAEKTLSWTLWASKSGKGPWRYVAHGTATTGATQTGETDEFYCDTIVITDQQWYKTVSKVDGAPETIVAGGGIAELITDSCEHTFWKGIIRDIGGDSPESATAGADIANFN